MSRDGGMTVTRSALSGWFVCMAEADLAFARSELERDAPACVSACQTAYRALREQTEFLKDGLSLNTAAEVRDMLRIALRLMQDRRFEPDSSYATEDNIFGIVQTAWLALDYADGDLVIRTYGP